MTSVSMLVVLEDLDDLLDEGHAVLGDVVEAADEGADEAGPGLGREEGLARGEDERHVDRDALAVRGSWSP